MKLHSFHLNDDSMINIDAAAIAEEEFSISKTPRQYDDKNFPYRPVAEVFDCIWDKPWPMQIEKQIENIN